LIVIVPDEAEKRLDCCC